MSWNSGGRQAKRRGKPGLQKAGGRANVRKKKNLPSSTYPDPEQEPESPQAPTGRTGIVSVNGRDVERMHCRHCQAAG